MRFLSKYSLCSHMMDTLQCQMVGKWHVHSVINLVFKPNKRKCMAYDQVSLSMSRPAHYHKKGEKLNRYTKF